MAVQLAPIERLHRGTSLAPRLDRQVGRVVLDSVARVVTALAAVVTVAALGSSEIAGVAVAGAVAVGATLFAWSAPRS